MFVVCACFQNLLNLVPGYVASVGAGGNVVDAWKAAGPVIVAGIKAV